VFSQRVVLVLNAAIKRRDRIHAAAKAWRDDPEGAGSIDDVINGYIPDYKRDPDYKRNPEYLSLCRVIKALEAALVSMKRQPHSDVTITPLMRARVKLGQRDLKVLRSAVGVSVNAIQLAHARIDDPAVWVGMPESIGWGAVTGLRVVITDLLGSQRMIDTMLSEDVEKEERV
jgi:hypothetical protein